MRKINIIAFAFIMLFFLSSAAYSAEEINCLDLAALQTERAEGILISENTAEPFVPMLINRETGLPTASFEKAYRFDCIGAIKKQFNVNDVNELKKFPLNVLYKPPYKVVIAPNLEAQQGCIAYFERVSLRWFTGPAEKQYVIEQLRCYKNPGKQPAFYCKGTGSTKPVYKPIPREFYSKESFDACDILDTIHKPINICPQGTICIERDPYSGNKLKTPICASQKYLPSDFHPWDDIDKIKESQMINPPPRRG